MDLALLIHPLVAASAVLLVVTAYLLKTRRRLYFRLHYAAGILAFSLTVTAFPLGLYFILSSGGPSAFPLVIIYHSVNFLAVVGLMVVQGGLGMGMLLFGRKRNAFVTHRRAAKYVVSVFALQGVLGLATLFGILPFVFGP